MKRCHLLIAALLGLATYGAGAAPSESVLVAGGRSPVGRLTVAEARKLFLGQPLRVQGLPLRPIHNDSDPLTREIFLQRVLFMTAEEYERHLKTRAGQSGGRPPQAYRELAPLVAALQSDPLAVSYMSRDQAKAKASSGLKIVGEP